MEFYKDKELAIFIFSDELEEKEFSNFINFMKDILTKQKDTIKAFSLEMFNQIIKIIKEIENNCFLKKREKEFYTNRKDFTLIVDNTKFILEGIKEKNKNTIDVLHICKELLKELQ